MRIAVSSQNFRTITSHAGKTRRFILFEGDLGQEVTETGRLDMDKSMALHNFNGKDHPLFDMDVVITGSCGEGFRRKLAQYQVEVVATSETDPANAAQAVLDQRPLPDAEPHQHK